GDSVALRIGNTAKAATEEVAEIRSPLNLAKTLRGKTAGPDVGHAACIKHVCSADGRGLARAEVDDETRRPAFHDASQNTRTVPEEHLARTDRQFKRAVGTEIVRDVVRAECVVFVAFRRI